MLLIVDNQSSFIKKFKRNFLSEQDFDYIIFDHNQPIILSAKTQISGLMLSGGKGSPYEPLNLTANFVSLMNFDVPTIGFCLGHEIIAIAHRGRLKKMPEYLMKKVKINITKPEDPIFEGLQTTEISLTRRHQFYVSELPADFECLAESEITYNEIIRHKTKPIYGFQAHPEVSGKDGMIIVTNFLKMCGLSING
jgi:GMP synthase (glutamine-hydrolysing)